MKGAESGEGGGILGEKGVRNNRDGERDGNDEGGDGKKKMSEGGGGGRRSDCERRGEE